MIPHGIPRGARFSLLLQSSSVNALQADHDAEDASDDLDVFDTVMFLMLVMLVMQMMPVMLAMMARAECAAVATEHTEEPCYPGARGHGKPRTLGAGAAASIAGENDIWTSTKGTAEPH